MAGTRRIDQERQMGANRDVKAEIKWRGFSSKRQARISSRGKLSDHSAAAVPPADAALSTRSENALIHSQPAVAQTAESSPAADALASKAADVLASKAAEAFPSTSAEAPSSTSAEALSSTSAEALSSIAAEAPSSIAAEDPSPFSRRDQRAGLHLHVFVPHYRNLRWLAVNLAMLQHRRGTTPAGIAVRYTVLDMDSVESVNEYLFNANVSMTNVSVVNFSHFSGVGGTPLPKVCEFAARTSNAPVTVLVDPDAVVLATGWDDFLLRTFAASPKLALLSINPRSNDPIFGNVAEWNWMAFDTCFFSARIAAYGYQNTYLRSGRRLHFEDIGHWFTWVARSNRKRVRLLPPLRSYLPGRSPMIAGEDGKPFALHSFYLSRRRNENLTELGESRWVMTKEEEDACLQYIASDAAAARWDVAAAPLGLSALTGLLAPACALPHRSAEEAFAQLASN